MVTTDYDELTLRAIGYGLLPCWFLMTAREVAEELSVCTETVLRWTRRGDLPGFRLPGGALRYREDDLLDWIESRSTNVDAMREYLEKKNGAQNEL